MKRERSTTTFAHVRASSVEFARAMVAAAPHLLQSARDEFAIVHKRLRGLAAAAATATPAHAMHHHHHSRNDSYSHRRQGSSVKAAVMSAATACMNPAATPAYYSSTGSDSAAGPSYSSHHQQQQQQQHPPPSVATGSHAAAAQLQFYGFYSTTAFDRSAISPAEAIVLAAEMAADIFSEASMLYDMLSEIKTPTDECRAVDELMARMHALLNDDARLPKSPADVTAAQASNVRNVYNGLVRVYIFLFQRYYREFVELDVSELLSASWQRLLAFAAEYRILDEAFILQVNDYVSKLVGPLQS